MGQIIRYVNSRGREMDLSSTFRARIRKKTAGFYDYEYTPETTGLAKGVRVNRMKKAAAEYTITLDVTGTPEERASSLQEFFELVDYDVAMETPGRFWVGSQYIDGFVIKSNMQYYETRHRTLGREFTLFAPYPYWIEDRTLRFRQTGEGQSDGIDLPTDFDFDLGQPLGGMESIRNTHYIPTSFLLTVYGPATNPALTIGGHLYKVNTELAAGEYLRIDSINKTVIRHTASGLDISEYNNREKTQSVFEPIPPGENALVWSGAFAFDLTLHQERSELRWK